MTDHMNTILAPGRVAVITGAAKGIGAALAHALAHRGMRLALFDRDRSALEATAAQLGNQALVVVGDVTAPDDLQRLHALVHAHFGATHLLVNNAGIIQRAGPWDPPQRWQATLDANFTSVLAAQALFVPSMITAGDDGAIVNLGSKEGITTPPGNAAYSVAKAGVKVLTEQLAHELRGATDGRISAHLLVPGYTWTPMNFPTMDAARDTKPEAPWSAEQLVEYALGRLLDEDFYILCPDNEVTPEMDARRIRWSMDDMLQNRPALSRWHPHWRAPFAEWMRG